MTDFSSKQRIGGMNASRSRTNEGIKASGDLRRSDDQKKFLCAISRNRVPRDADIIKEANLRVLIERSD
jgi:hypothetical protein